MLGRTSAEYIMGVIGVKACRSTDNPRASRTGIGRWRLSEVAGPQASHVRTVNEGSVSERAVWEGESTTNAWEAFFTRVRWTGKWRDDILLCRSFHGGVFEEGF